MKIPVQRTEAGIFVDGVRIEAADCAGRLSPDALRDLGIGARSRIKRCQHCGAYYLGDWKSVTCSVACRDARQLAAHLDRQRKKRTADKARRKSPGFAGDCEVRCQHCGDLFVSIRRSARYCSAACKQSAYRSRAE